MAVISVLLSCKTLRRKDTRKAKTVYRFQNSCTNFYWMTSFHVQIYHNETILSFGRWMMCYFCILYSCELQTPESKAKFLQSLLARSAYVFDVPFVLRIIFDKTLVYRGGKCSSKFDHRVCQKDQRINRSWSVIFRPGSPLSAMTETREIRN